MTRFIKTDDPNWLRDPHTKALVPANSRAADDYTVKSAMLQNVRDQGARINSLEERLDSMESKLDAIFRAIVK